MIGLLTEDPRTYFGMLEVLREKGLKFVSLEPGEAVAANVGVVITTEAERHKVSFDKIVTDPDPDEAVTKAIRLMNGERAIKNLVIGIDPGSRPGVAALGDGVVLSRSLAQSPEDVGKVVDDLVQGYPAVNVLIRIGNGDRTNRNRIFNRLWDDGHRLEIVDERNTTTRSQTPDEDAAVEIAATPGYKPCKKQEISPCDGELRNIQRLSRLQSRGTLTVSKRLAEKVAIGEISLEQAIELQRNSGSGSS